ncbi:MULTISPECIES: hypothetical protein [Cytobacillus]|uniref:Transposase n=1 Tax=Cytobacillus stercorigallinarum TaxID=2762240 RepID=A0ABR8QVC5_9BACI|nr:hypothetical protein [Cytobacillus stercorigallinarum]MBD7939497.1 hypothetical protein [Cytobacillus stercorigallinarum]
MGKKGRGSYKLWLLEVKEEPLEYRQKAARNGREHALEISPEKVQLT